MVQKSRETGEYTIPPSMVPQQDIPDQGVTSLEKFGQNQILQDDSNIYCLTIIGQVEGHYVLPAQNKTTKYEHVIPQLVAAEQSEKIEGVLIILNTVGGDVEAGLALSEMIASLSKPTVTLVLGGGHSIGVPIATASDYSFIADTASMTVHPIRLNGLIIGVPQSFEYLERMQERVTRFITKHSVISESTLRELMMKTGELTRDIGTTLIGADAVEYGIINEIGGVGKAMAKLKMMIDEYRFRKQKGGII